MGTNARVSSRKEHAALRGLEQSRLIVDRTPVNAPFVAEEVGCLARRAEIGQACAVGCDKQACASGARLM